MRRMIKKLVWFLILVLTIIWFFFYGGKKMFLQFFYPVQYEEYVEKYAKEYDLDKYLIYAVIHTESKFDEKAVSDAGAIGLMQLMEDTASDYNNKGKFGYIIPEQLLEPDVNIRLGCYYLSELMQRFKKRELAIMAYNAGPGNVEEWLLNDMFSDGEGGLNSTPFKETNDYVDKVLKSYKRYKEIY